MNCSDLEDCAPLYLSGELEQSRRTLYDAHLAECRACAERMKQQIAMDVRVRAAFSAMPDAAPLQASVRTHIRQERSRRWRAMVLAAAAVFVIAGAFSYRLLKPSRLYSDAARDHHAEVVEHQPRRWRTDPAEIDKLAARIQLSSVAPSLAGYRLEHAKMCGLDGKAALHLVYSDGTQEVSVYLRRREGAPDKTVRSTKVGSERLASFETDRFEAIIATDGSRMECLAIARAAVQSL